jgi:MFS family permease
MGGGYVAGRLLGGLVAPERRTTAALISAMLGMMAMIWLLWAKEPWSFYAFAIMLGISWGCLLNFVTLLVGDIFGMRKLGAIMGSIAAAWIAGSAVGPLVGGYIYDLTGSYSGAFIFGAAAMAGAALCLLLMKSPEGKPARVKTS